MACAIVRSANICMSPLQHVLHRFFFSRYRIVFTRTEPDVTLAGDEYFDLIPPIFSAARVLYAFNFRYGRLAFVTEREVSNFPDKGKSTFFLRIFYLPRVSVPRNFSMRIGKLRKSKYMYVNTKQLDRRWEVFFCQHNIFNFFHIAYKEYFFSKPFSA